MNKTFALTFILFISNLINSMQSTIRLDNPQLVVSQFEGLSEAQQVRMKIQIERYNKLISSGTIEEVESLVANLEKHPAVALPQPVIEYIQSKAQEAKKHLEYLKNLEQ